MSDFPYLPHTERDIDEMMNYLNIKDINELYQDVPQLFLTKILIFLLL